MKIYITARFKYGESRKGIEELCSIINRSGFEEFCFTRDIENYQKIFTDDHELMERAKQEIKNCDALLIDYDGPANGRMIELGIAYGLNKKIILIAKKGLMIKETVSGVADRIIEYEKLEEVIEPLKNTLSLWEKK